MAFPTTPVLVNFANDGGAPRNLQAWSPQDWSTSSLWPSNFQTNADGTAHSPAPNAGNWFTRQNYGPDCEVYCTVTQKPTEAIGAYIALYLRVNEIGANTSDGYEMEWDCLSGGTDTVSIYRMENESFAQLTGTFIAAQELTAGDSIGFEAVGATLKIWYKAAAGSWTNIGSTTDNRWTNAGRIGIQGGGAAGASGAIDDFGGGTTITTVAAAVEYRNDFSRLPKR